MVPDSEGLGRRGKGTPGPRDWENFDLGLKSSSVKEEQLGPRSLGAPQIPGLGQGLPEPRVAPREGLQ